MVEALATGHNMVFCATDFWGLANGDIGNDAAALGNLNLFGAVVDRLQQGALNTLYLGRLMLNPAGAGLQRRLPAARAAGDRDLEPVLRRQQPGRDRGRNAHRAVPDFRHAVLGVTGIDYANLLVQRSTDFAPFGKLLYAAYPDQSVASAHPRPHAAAVGPWRARRLRRSR